MSTFTDSQQRAAIQEDLSGGLFVEAGAGTGKTTAMIKRVVALLSKGTATIDSIAVITFTEAAAGEMRERLRFSLETAVAADKPEIASRCDAALRGLEDAAIGTIHGFAQRIVQQFAVEVAVPPTFDVQDAVVSRLRSDERWSAYLHRLLGSSEGLTPDQQQLIAVATSLGLTQRQLQQLAAAFAATWHRVNTLATNGLTPYSSISPKRIIDELHLVVDVPKACTDESDQMVSLITDQIDPWMRRLEQADRNDDQPGVLDALTNAPSLKVSRKGNSKNWNKEQLADLRETLLAVERQRCELLEGPRQWALTGIAGLLASFIQNEAEHRRTTGRLDFHDLLVYAVEATRIPQVGRVLRNRYRYLFVDEFQDTDALQVELIEALTRQDGCGEPAQLFTVGDPKQSIYRFRGADLDQFYRFRDAASIARVNLATNFRTLPSLLEWIDEAFAKLMTDNESGEWVGLTAARETVPSVFGSVGVLGGVVDGARASEVREVEANAVVEMMIEAKRSGWTVEDNHGKQRGILYGDMAVLMPTRRGLPALERAFRRSSVPYRVESRSLIWATQEVRDVVAILKCIANPRDEVSLVATLRSPAFGCGDDDLYTWRKARGVWQYTASVDPTLQEHPVAKAFERLGKLHERQFAVPVTRFVGELLAELQMFELAFARARQREAWHRLRFLLDRARLWSEDGGSGLQAFVQWISLQEEQSADALESVVPETDDDAVRVMTIHAAKGLEFPLVTIVGLGTKETNSDSARAFWSEDGTCHIRLGNKDLGWQSPGFPVRDGLEAEARSREQQRLLYVAATRARDHLRVSLFRTKSSGGTLADKLEQVIPSGAEHVQPATQSANASLEQLSLSTAHVDTLQGRRARRDAVINTASRSISLSATAIATAQAGMNDVLPHSTIGSSDSAAIELAERLSFGSAVHATLQRVAFDASDDAIDSVAERQAVAFGIAHRTVDVVTSVKLAHGAPVMRAAARSINSWREVPVFAPAGDRVIGGSVDLLYDDGEGLVVVDYKTEDVTDESERVAAIERYRWQLLTYAYACAKTTQRKVTNAVLLFISPKSGEAVEVDIGPLDQAVEDLVNKILPELG